MSAESQRWQSDLEAVIWSGEPLEKVVSLLRRWKDQGVSQEAVYATLEALRPQAPNEALEDRILEVADFVSGFCSPHMRIWDK